MISFSVIILGVVFLGVNAEQPAVYYLSDEYIDHLNQQNLPWTAGRNFPSDLTQSDVERMFGTKPATELPEVPHPTELRKSYGGVNAFNTIPDTFDAREYFKSCASVISVVTDQGSCASSYAFAIPSVASDRLCIHSQGRVQKLLSSQYVASCCKMCRYPHEDQICTGGISSSTWAWIHKRGLVTGGGYKSNTGCQPVSFPPCNHGTSSSSLPSCKNMDPPKPKCHTRCTNDNYGRGFFHDKYRFKKYYWLSYKGGVYSVSDNANILAYITVKIIGWGVEDSRPYWTVVSTFGESFGNHGTFKILRGRNMAIVESLVNAALPRGNY
uniref:Cathepsin B n=1 Tax=Cacopsylla melanoneura TaxID=428564 RepID=A0A8D8TDZ2_9HEMI